jgi:hypothetical protein
MNNRKKSSGLVPIRSSKAMTDAERQKRRRDLQDAGQILIKGLTLDEATLFNGLFDKIWIDREDGDDPEALIAGLRRLLNFMFEVDDEGYFFRLPNAPDAVLRLRAAQIEKPGGSVTRDGTEE